MLQELEKITAAKGAITTVKTTRCKETMMIAYKF